MRHVIFRSLPTFGDEDTWHDSQTDPAHARRFTRSELQRMNIRVDGGEQLANCLNLKLTK